MKSYIYKILTSCIASLTTFGISASVDWSQSAKLPGPTHCEIHNGHKVCLSEQNRKNIYQLDQTQLDNYVIKGAKHALYYPVNITPLQIPMEAMDQFFNQQSSSPIKRFFFKIAKKISNFNQMSDVYSWLGLHDYPKADEFGPNPIPDMGDLQKDPMGTTIYKNQSKSMTFSCAACHSADLFGTKVLGLTNRFPRANEFFHLGKKILKSTPTFIYRSLFRPNQEHLNIFKTSKNAIGYVDVKKPMALGLDTSLAQVGLSLSRRGLDPYAKRTRMNARFPRPNPLNHKPADSKPAVWWNLKYKTRWLSDGSIISGNPVHTNFLWNEIGRGIDLKDLEKWLIQNKKTIKELTSFVFASQSPQFNDFFPNHINIDMAKKGEKLFLKNCSGCHGKYEKAWNEPNTTHYQEAIKTTKVHYHQKTPVIDVGTDPHRYQGMNYFAKDLNRLKISKTIGTVVKPQVGYVPPPLVGIWSRWPYFHNNSVPTLYDVLTPDFKRPKSYIAVASDDKKDDFNILKNGYPSPQFVRQKYRTNKDYHFNTKKAGLSNQGHTRMLIDESGREKFSHQEKLQLIHFLQSL